MGKNVEWHRRSQSGGLNEAHRFVNHQMYLTLPFFTRGRAMSLS